MVLVLYCIDHEVPGDPARLYTSFDNVVVRFFGGGFGGRKIGNMGNGTGVTEYSRARLENNRTISVPLVSNRVRTRNTFSVGADR